jgi:hypothetical protein
MLRRAGVTLLPKVDLPNEVEIDRLLAKIEAKYPCLKGPADASYKKQFAESIHYLAFVFRPDKADTLHHVNVWIDNAREFLRGQGYNPSPIGLKPFVAAAVASGIVYETLDEFPFSINLGIGLGSASRPSNAWRDVLRNGIPAPVEPRNRAPVRAQPIDVVLR